MSNDRRCGTCINMRPTDGYCPRTGWWVNALDDTPRRCYVGKDEVDFDSHDQHPPVREVKDPAKKPRRTVWRSGRGVPDGKKYCPTCERTLPIGNFCTCKTRYDGVNWECKECAAARTRTRKALRRAMAAGKNKPQGKN